MPSHSEVTKILLASLYMYPEDLRKDIEEREEHPYKAPPPEHGLDIEALQDELKKIKKRNFNRSRFIIFTTLTILPLLIFFDKDYYIIIPFIIIPILFLLDFKYIRENTSDARNIMHSSSDCSDNRIYFNKNILISGGFSPFIGSGVDIGNWSFVVDTKKLEKKGEAIGDVKIKEIYEEIESKIKDLDIENLSFFDEILINGCDVKYKHKKLLPNGRFSRPEQSLDEEYIDSKINKNNEFYRHYKVIRVPMWQGQMLLSIYYRIIVSRNNLFLEAKFFILPPLKARYLKLRNMVKDPVIQEIRWDFFRCLFSSLYSWAIVYFHAFHYLLKGFWVKRSRQKKWYTDVECNKSYNYGWGLSLREKWSATSYERYFQQVDKDFIVKSITNEFFSALSGYLHEKNISTDQFNNSITKIINEGVIVSNGDFKADSVAVGKNSTVNSSKKS